MAKAQYIGVSGVARKVTKNYIGVSGVARKVKSGYIGVDGVARQYFSGGTPISTLAVGDSVWLNVDGVQTEFLVVHQGNPDSAIYDASCDGTWLLMKDCYERMAWGYSNNDYPSSIVHEYLEGTFLELLDIQSIIKQVKIPYGGGTGSGGNQSTKIFLLSSYEVGFTTSTYSRMSTEGSKLDYFSSYDASTRIAYFNGEAANWYLRSVSTDVKTGVYSVEDDGTAFAGYYTNKYRVRPAFILDSNTPIAQADGKYIIE